MRYYGIFFEVGCRLEPKCHPRQGSYRQCKVESNFPCIILRAAFKVSTISVPCKDKSSLMLACFLIR